jgi:hypothetical protein
MKTQLLKAVIESLAEVRLHLSDNADASVIKDIDEAIVQLSKLENSGSEVTATKLSCRGIEVLGKVLERLPQIEALIRVLLD